MVKNGDGTASNSCSAGTGGNSTSTCGKMNGYGNVHDHQTMGSRNQWFNMFHEDAHKRRRSLPVNNCGFENDHAIHLKVDDAIFSMFKDKNGLVRVNDFITAITATGIRKDDLRLKETMEKIKNFQNEKGEADFDATDALLTEGQFKEAISSNIVFVDSILRNRFVVPEWRKFCQDLTDAYQKCKPNLDGRLCQYIPQLARVDSDQWAVSVCTVDGQRFSIGDTKARFTLQAAFAPFNYAIALNEIGGHLVHKFVGQEPSGRHYNDIALDTRKKPHNPMINSGAMVICSMLKEEMTMADRFDYLFNIYQRMAGGDYVGFSNTTCLSEKATADRNFALAHYLRENKCLGGVKFTEMLQLYFQLCSIEVTTDSGSVFAATLANGGICPLSGEKLFEASCTRDALSLMYSCGMNDFSGQFSFNVGLPAKSGVSGVITLVVPDVMGVCLYSPLLDDHSNSVRGVQFCTQLVKMFNFHNYDNLKHTFQKFNPLKRVTESKAEQVVNLLFSAANGDVSAIRRYWMEGTDLSIGDYDGRTALHLAAAEGRKSCVLFLLEKCGANHLAKDRWNCTPLDDAIRGGHREIVKILKDWDQKIFEPQDIVDSGDDEIFRARSLSEIFRSFSPENSENYEMERAEWIRNNLNK